MAPSHRGRKSPKGGLLPEVTGQVSDDVTFGPERFPPEYKPLLSSGPTTCVNASEGSFSFYRPRAAVSCPLLAQNGTLTQTRSNHCYYVMFLCLGVPCLSEGM